ncbi:MAG TPA: Cthe_2314 family HEPN domain-containing protein [Arachidicoccus sp.]
MFTYLNRYTISLKSKEQQYFRYFAEIITYYFISIRDNILQLINAYVDFPVKQEHKVNLDKIQKNLKHEHLELLEIVNKFEFYTKEFREKIRNNFTHNTNPFNGYYITEFNADNVLGIDYSDSLENEDFYKTIIENLKYLSDFIERLRTIIY